MTNNIELEDRDGPYGLVQEGEHGGRIVNFTYSKSDAEAWLGLTEGYLGVIEIEGFDYRDFTGRSFDAKLTAYLNKEYGLIPIPQTVEDYTSLLKVEKTACRSLVGDIHYVIEKYGIVVGDNGRLKLEERE